MPELNTKNVKTQNIKGYFRPEDLYWALDRFVSNVKSGMPPVCVLIHGYGSHGTDALIHDRARKYLKEKYSGGIRIVNGEDFNIFNEDARVLKARYPELETYMKVCNHGVTIIGKR